MARQPTSSMRAASRRDRIEQATCDRAWDAAEQMRNKLEKAYLKSSFSLLTEFANDGRLNPIHAARANYCRGGVDALLDMQDYFKPTQGKKEKL